MRTVVKSRAGEHVKNGRSTNTMEGFWSLVTRGTNGTYINVARKHLQSYLSELYDRYNMRHQAHMMLDLLHRSFPKAA